MDVWERQLGDGAYSGYGPAGEDEKVDWWWTPAGMATRYAIVAAIFAALVAFFLGGYWHAQRRIAQGKQPLAYHRWMVRRPYYAYPPPLGGGGPSNSQQYAFTTSGAGGPGNENYPPPPPAYNNAAFPPPPSYQQRMPQQQQPQPPQGGSKALADQNFPAGFTHRAGESSGAQGNGEVDSSGATTSPYGRETV